MNKITIYTNESCKYCKQIKEELTKNNIEFENVLTKDNTEEWQSIISLTGIPTVPTMYYRGNYFVPARDFSSPEHLLAIIKNFKESKYSGELQLLERIKTLNFHISTAFQNMEKAINKLENKLNTEK